MEHMQSELTVITRAKDLCSYIMAVTQKSPRQFRFTFTSRLQNLSLDVIESFIISDLKANKMHKSVSVGDLCDYRTIKISVSKT